MAGIVLSQPSGVGTLNAAGAQHPAPFDLDAGFICQLSFTGTTTRYRWVLTKPASSAAVLSSTTSAGPSFLPDVEGGSYSVSLFDSNEVEYVLDIVTATSGSGGAGGSGGAVATTVATYAELRSAATFSPAVPPATITIKCRSTVNDGGGGLFAYDSGDTATADNDGTVIVSADGYRYKRIHADIINAAWFGGGPGIADSRAGAQAAIDYVVALQVQSIVANNGTTYGRPGVFFPAGHYRFSRIPGRYHCLELPPIVGMYGEPGATLFEPVDADKFEVEIVMIACFKNTIRDIIFARAFAAIGLCGASVNHGVFNAAVGLEKTSIDGCEFYGCIGPALLHNPDHANTNRSIQSPILVTNFRFHGPHLYWGSSDNIRFSHGVIEWDQWNPADIAVPPDIVQRDATTNPLGCFTTNGHLFVDNVMFGPNGIGIGAVVDPRSVWLRGSGEVSLDSCTFFDLQFPLMREGMTDSDTAGPWTASHPIPGHDDPSPTARLFLKLKNTYPSVIGVNWLEIYDHWPAELVIEGNTDLPLDASLGIMVESGVSLTEILQAHQTLQVVRTGQLLSLRGWRVRQCDDADFDDETAGADITELFTHRWEEPFERKHVESAQQDNIFLPDKYNATQLESASAGTGTTTDTSTGYVLQQWIADSADDEFSFRTQDCGALGWAAGVYTFSCYVKFTKSTVLALGYQLAGGAGTNVANRRVPGSPNWQRVEFPFYYPGGAVSIKFVGASAKLSAGTVSGSGLFMVNPGAKAAPYRFPKNSTTAIADTAVPSDPADPNGEIASWLRTGNVGRWRAAVPTTGIYLRGEIFWNISPSAAGPIGWVCTVGGEPGTWVRFGVIGADAPDMAVKDVSAAGTITLTEDEASHERIKFNGSPAGALSVVVDAGAATGWVRTFWNACGQTVTVKGSSGDTGIAILDGTVTQIFSDGTNASPVADRRTVSTLSRVVRGIPFFYESEGDIDEYGRFTVNVTTGAVVKTPLEAPNGATLTAVMLRVIGGGNTNLPANMPLFRVRKLDITTNSTSTVGTATDSSADVSAYNAQHNILLSGLSETIDNTVYRYIIEFVSESGANATTGFTVISAEASYTVTDPDKGAA